jgi:hypothetical protein
MSAAPRPARPAALIALVALAFVAAASADTTGTTLRGYTFSTDVSGERAACGGARTRLAGGAPARSAAVGRPAGRGPHAAAAHLQWACPSGLRHGSQFNAGSRFFCYPGHRASSGPAQTPAPPARAPRRLSEYLGISQDICDIRKMLNVQQPPYNLTLVRRRRHPSRSACIAAAAAAAPTCALSSPTHSAPRARWPRAAASHSLLPTPRPAGHLHEWQERQARRRQPAEHA